MTDHNDQPEGGRINMSKDGSPDDTSDGYGLPEGHVDLSKLGENAELPDAMVVIYASITHHVPFIEYGTPVDYLKAAGIGVGLAGFFSGKSVKGTNEDGYVRGLKMRARVPDDIIELAVAKDLWNG